MQKSYHSFGGIRRKSQIVTFKIPAPDSLSNHPDIHLNLRVDGVHWIQVRKLDSLKPDDPCYTVSIDADGNASINFGDGVNGSRLPDGSRISALYRTGVGSVGNVSGKNDESKVPFQDIVYLDITSEKVKAVEDPKLREIADGGPDTTARRK